MKHDRLIQLAASLVAVGPATVCGIYLTGVGRLTAIFTPGHAPGHLAFRDGPSGVVVAGKSGEAARELRQLWGNREVQKQYLVKLNVQPALYEAC